MPEHSLLTDAVVYLGAAVVFVPLAKRFGLGSVLGYLIAGCVIGPFGLGLVQDVERILHFAEFGVVLMLFVIGLELEPARLWAMRSAVFGAGSLQMAVCGAGITLAARALGLPWAAAVVAGLALALSSTAIAVQTMTERGLLGSPLGRVAFGILLFQDIAAIPLLGIVPLLGERPAGAASSPWMGAATIATAIVGVIAIGRYATRPALRAIARTDLREVFTAFALFLVVGIAQVMELAGVSMALGAFLAGVLLASSEYRHALETDIEPFKGLLLGLFFIAVGMSIDFGLLAAHPFRLLAMVVGFVALKTALLLAVSLGAGVPRGQHATFAALLSQGGEFAFVVFGVAGAVRVMPGDWGETLTLVVALSMVLTPLVLLAADAVVRRLATEREPDQVDAEDAPVIIAGFGRFGQIVGRLLFASGLRATVLDHDPDNIELLRRLGFRVFYGDATRQDLLESAGAARARVLVNAIDDVGANTKLVQVARRHFPHLTIVARARNVSHWHELKLLQVNVIERETFESAVLAGRRALETLGVRPYEARERADRFRRHNLAMLEALHPQWADEERRTAVARAARDELEQQFQRDVDALERGDGDGGWAAAPLRTRPR
jgi:glutathione-regulated potassium-efflux system ancillary protein KefC